MSGFSVAVVVAFMSGHPTNVQTLGIAPSLSECQVKLAQIVKSHMSAMPPGVTVKYKCVDMTDAEDTGKVKT